MIFYFLISIIDGFLIFLLPETKDREIPENLPQAENVVRIKMRHNSELRTKS